ncbi:50S ribosomal protein L30e [Candidatus Geothermarchaeota archaeon]|nr:MAG: 50S ribosomal protein L30e [Candidatus Geothermarchaeota archaeon]
MPIRNELINEVERQLRLVAKTGKIVYGVNNVKWALKNRRVKLVIMASNIPNEMENDLRKLCKKRNIPIFKSSLTNIELGSKCLRPHIVTAVAVLDFGLLSQKEEIMKSA